MCDILYYCVDYLRNGRAETESFGLDKDAAERRYEELCNENPNMTIRLGYVIKDVGKMSLRTSWWDDDTKSFWEDIHKRFKEGI